MPYDRYDSTNKFTICYSSAMIRNPHQYKDIFRLCCGLLAVRSYRNVVGGEPVSSHYWESTSNSGIWTLMQLSIECHRNCLHRVAGYHSIVARLRAGSFPAWARDFAFLRNIQIGGVSTGVLFFWHRGNEATWAWNWPLSPPNAQVKNERSCILTPVWLYGMRWSNLIFVMPAVNGNKAPVMRCTTMVLPK
jgi:hypothetical protein